MMESLRGENPIKDFQENFKSFKYNSDTIE